MRLSRWLLAAALAALCPLVAADAPLLVQFDPENSPFMYLAPGTKDGAAGLYPGIIQEAFKRMGVAVTLKAIAWKQALADADAGKAGIGGIYKNDERVKKYEYSEALFAERILAYSSKSHRVTELKDGMTVGVQSGWSYGSKFDSERKAGKYKVVEGTDLTNFKALDEGKVDVVLAAPETATKALGANLEKNYTAIATPVTLNQTFLIFPKNMNKADLIAKFNAVLAAMKADGTVRKIVQGELAK